MNFFPLYIIGAILISYVLFESVVIYRKAYKRGLELGMTKTQLNETTRSSAIFSIVPSLPILIGLVTMIPLFGNVVIPWIRLSVIGSVSYETYAASQIKQAAGVASLTENLQVYSTAIWTMTLSILSGMIILIFFYKQYTNKLEAIKIKNRTLVRTLDSGTVHGFGWDNWSPANHHGWIQRLSTVHQYYHHGCSCFDISKIQVDGGVCTSGLNVGNLDCALLHHGGVK